MTDFTPKLSSEDLIGSLRQRAAVKSFVSANSEGETKVEIEKNIAVTKEVLQLTPTSYGLQPCKYIFITNPDIREELKKHSYNQPQVADADFLVVFCVKTNIDEYAVDEYISEVASTREVDKEKLSGFGDIIKGTIDQLGKEGTISWAEKQAYIAMGNALTALAVLGMDCCPMEGFNSAEYDRVLALNEKKLKSVLVLPVGKRSNLDPSSTQKKVRFAIEKVCLDIG